MTDISFTCPHCEQRLDAPPEMAGDQLACPTCQKQIQVPTVAPVRLIPRRKPLLGRVAAGVVGGLDHIPPPQMFHRLVDAEDLRRSRQTQGGPVYLLAPKLARFDPPMAFIARLGLRGEDRPRGALWPSRRP